MFLDRYDAGKQLALKLQHYKNADAVIYALPRGGVPVGYEVAKMLRLPLGLIITRKIGHPLNEEVAVCAINEEGELVCDELALYGIDETWIESQTAAQKDEVKRRRKKYQPYTPVEYSTSKIAIIVDDGVATGLTLKAAILGVKKQFPKKIVVAVPVSPYEVSQELRTMVDELVVLFCDQRYRGAVGAYYTHFDQVTDAEVVACLRETTYSQNKNRKPPALVSG